MVPSWNAQGRLVLLCIWPYFILCCRLLALQENVSSAKGFNREPIVSSHSLCQSWQSHSWTCWWKWFITEWKERQNSTVHKFSFLTFFIPEDPTVTCYNTNNFELSDLTDSWVAIQGNTGPCTGRESKEGWSHWLTEALVSGHPPAHTQADIRWHPDLIPHNVGFPLAGLAEAAEACLKPCLTLSYQHAFFQWRVQPKIVEIIKCSKIFFFNVYNQSILLSKEF